MRLYVVRHGQTRYNVLGKTTGSRIDDELTQKGEEQAEKIYTLIPESITRIYSSDFLRTRQTANILNRSLSVPISFHQELRERDFGTITGMTWSEIGELPGDLVDLDRALQYDYRGFGGESAEDVRKRISLFVARVKEKDKDPVIIVTHGGIIKMLHKIFNDDHITTIQNASVHKFDI